MAWVNELVQFDQNFDFEKEGIIEKISYERRVNESVDDRSLSYAISQKLTEKVIHVIKVFDYFV